MNRRLTSHTFAVAAIALAPYPTVLFPFHLALWVQGGLIVVILGALAVGHLGALLRAVCDAPRVLRWGLTLYASSALWGAVVGIASGNPLRYVVTQLASMLLIPAAFLAFGREPSIKPEELAGGLGLAAAAALAIHAGAFLGLDALQPPAGEPFRLCLRNDVSFAGFAVLGFLVTAAWRRRTRGWAPTGAFLCLAALLVGSMSRGAWIAAAVGIAVWAAVTGLLGLRTIVRVVALLAAALALTAAAAYWVGRRAEHPVVPSLPAADRSLFPAVPSGDGAHVVAPAGSGGHSAQLVSGLAIQARAVEVDAWLHGGEGTYAILVIEGQRGPGEATVKARILRNGGNAWLPLRVVQFLPAGVQSVDLSLSTSGGQWLLADLRVRPLESTAAAWVRAFWLRLDSTVQAFVGPVDEPTTRYRLGEWKAVRSRWVEAAPLRLVVGQGLGATFPFLNASYDAGGRRVMLPTGSYIHNFYVFLGFKLGLAGLAALAGLLLLAGWTAVRAVRERGSAPANWLVPAAAAAWLAYLVWGVTSPEILNFRVAPIWGALLAATQERTRDPVASDTLATPAAGRGGLA